MNQTWSSMVSTTEDDFSNLVDFSDFNPAFLDFDESPQNGGDVDSHSPVAMDAVMGDLDMAMTLRNANREHQGDQGGMQSELRMPSMSDMSGSTDSLLDIEIQARIFQQQQQQQTHGTHDQKYQRRHIVPPTPNSSEMHGGHDHYYSPADRQTLAMYDHYNRNPKDQVIFTPLVSPAVTPLEAQFRVPEYTTPGDYFSPLASPALHAERQQSQRPMYGTVRGSDTSDTTSPIDMNIDINATPAESDAGPVRKLRRKNTVNTPKNPVRTVKRSPAMKPQARRKHLSITAIPPKEVTDIIEDARKSRQASKRIQPTNSKLPLPRSQDTSEAESASPDYLSEVLMPPPATPRPVSTSRSPHFHAQPGSQSAPMPAMTSSPATPASLMRIQKSRTGVDGESRSADLKEQALQAEADLEQIMDEICLPEPATTSKPKAKPPRINTRLRNSNQSTPMPSAQQTPIIGNISAPSTATSTVFPSPHIRDSSSLSFSGSKHIEQKGIGRSSKKRNSSSSSQISPALRPKISPNVKPLLPEGATVNAETSAFLLASKSNYQNIIEGTHLPGVSYPEALSTNLTSKRTSHKIAEQGRRNRINTALQEIASLLPSSAPQMAGNSPDAAGSSMTTGTAAQQNSSKASTVELAIDYIKSLQSELADVKGKLHVAESKLSQGEGAAEE